MSFEKLYQVVSEAKGTKPGERFQSVKNNAGPSGISSSPVGKSSYNPELRVDNNPLPKDKGAGDASSVIKLLGKAFQVLKNDEVFVDQMRGIMNGFKRNRHQISGYQESVIKTKPKTIDNLWGEINRLIKVVNNPEMRQRDDLEKYIVELDTVRDRKDEHEAELNKVYDEVEAVADKNEELNNEYLEQMLTVVKHTTKRLYDQLSKELAGDKGQDFKTSVPINELDFDKLQTKLSNDALAQLQLLEMLMSTNGEFTQGKIEGPNEEGSSKVNSNLSNPLLIFLDLQEKQYDDAKNRFFQVKNGDNYSVTIEQLYRNLPLFSLINYFSHVILKSPAIKLSKNQDKRTKAGTQGNMVEKLGNIKSEAQFEAIKPELLNYLDGLTIPQKEQLKQVANGPFIARKGGANAATKIRSSLVSSNITESFDDIAGKLLMLYA